MQAQGKPNQIRECKNQDSLARDCTHVVSSVSLWERDRERERKRGIILVNARGLRLPRVACVCVCVLFLNPGGAEWFKKNRSST